MPHDTSLIGTIVAGLGVAFLMGALAHRLRISPIAGYLLAGVLVGPFTPGFVADTGLAMQLAEIGVVLLPAMFGNRGDEGGSAGLLQSAAIVLLKVVGFVAFMFVVARRILPWVL